MATHPTDYGPVLHAQDNKAAFRALFDDAGRETLPALIAYGAFRAEQRAERQVGARRAKKRAGRR